MDRTPIYAAISLTPMCPRCPLVLRIEGPRVLNQAMAVSCDCGWSGWAWTYVSAEHVVQLTQPVARRQHLPVGVTD